MAKKNKTEAKVVKMQPDHKTKTDNIHLHTGYSKAYQILEHTYLNHA